MTYYEKYMKYKHKYTILKQQGGVIIDPGKLSFISIEYPSKEFNEIQPILTSISYISAPESFKQGEPYVPLPFLNNPIESTIIIGYTEDKKPIIFMTITDKDLMEDSPQIGHDELIRRGAHNDNETAWYITDLYGLHDKYFGNNFL